MESGGYLRSDRDPAGTRPERQDDRRSGLLSVPQRPDERVHSEHRESAKGREVLYNPSKFGDKIHAIIGQGDGQLPLLYKVGDKAPALTPDSPLVKDKSRYSVRESGFGYAINRLADWTTKAARRSVPQRRIDVSRTRSSDPSSRRRLRGYS